jgi:hypothetical protein
LTPPRRLFFLEWLEMNTRREILEAVCLAGLVVSSLTNPADVRA